MEETIVPAAGVAMEPLRMRGVQEEMWRNLPLLYALPAALARASAIISRFRPDAVLGTGGYITAPVGAAALVRRVPLFLQEQNAIPGRTTRVLAARARTVCAAYPDTARLLPRAHVVHTGTPVRADFQDRAREVGELRRLVVFGGSQGAHRINVAMAESIKTLLDVDGLAVHHVCGQHDLEWLHGFRAGLPTDRAARYQVDAFVTEMAGVLAGADLVVARAGGSGIAEMTAMGLPMILVPYPFAGEHQRFNAEPLAEAGAAVVVRDAELSGATLTRAVQRLAGSEGAARLREMAAASRAFGRPHAAEEVARLLLEAA
ncbi:MAG: UDP-N-acetylglucosamine--N-acetylmuramyl-(pentapeptide) pyrophosphoryl-undecaprenol [Chloroflexota bacterium]|jgi:UDP-N-acetylglucosamine--N-acetylmuramyl-(pentapeptide) pyrophosphoryl-undecaprenol N-acetylglucosamine transferase|nr:UDP-N-acetylglucosamine--N-acetylmuramyl-(pentapeptide) pyrophosphoryl-undecaprenol [Chloroflexota bacterium]